MKTFNFKTPFTGKVEITVNEVFTLGGQTFIKFCACVENRQCISGYKSTTVQAITTDKVAVKDVYSEGEENAIINGYFLTEQKREVNNWILSLPVNQQVSA